MKNFVVLGIALALAGCADSKSSPATMADRTNEFDVICLDGVQYWYTSGNLSGTAAVMAPRYKSAGWKGSPIVLDCPTATEKMQ